jgi:hypothetical protein
LLDQLVTLGFQALVELPHLAVVLLQHIGSLQQFFKSLLVENWFFVLVGHDFYLLLQSTQGGQG